MKYFLICLLAILTINFNSHCQDQDFKKILKGRYVMETANCAGFEFIGNNRVIWRDESGCMSPETLAIHWLNEKTFVTKDLKQRNEACPPRNSIYTVAYFDGETLELKKLWTGWGEYSEDALIFTKWNRE
ncbi:MAG: hypothetical protein NXI20_28515 [bacterium]|nr:hypothetical protein [bacterium]